MRILAILVTLVLVQSCTTTDISTAFDDTRNESLATKRIREAHPAFKDANFSVTSFKGIVLITGQVPSAEMIPLATAEVEPLRNVRKVFNELSVAGKTTMISRTNDGWLTTKVKSSLGASEIAEASRIKVVTEDSVVYLMGLVTRAEAEAAVDTAREVEGVQKIIKLFEYIN